MNKNYSLALWWWAARWISHIWIIKYIEEKNIKIDEISWTSIWAIIWWAFALWIDSKKMIDIIKEIKFYKLIDFNLHEWVVYGDKVYKLLYEIFWDKTFDDTNISLIIIATNLKTWDKKVFKKWKIIDAVRASISLPWIFAPYNIENEKFLDWWLHSNLPVLELTWKNIIAVSAIREEEIWEINAYKNILWFNLKTSFIKYNYKVLKRSFSIIMKNNEDLSIQIAKNNSKNIQLIAPNVWIFEYYDFHKYEEIINLWYEAIKDISLN